MKKLLISVAGALMALSAGAAPVSHTQQAGATPYADPTHGCVCGDDKDVKKCKPGDIVEYKRGVMAPFNDEFAIRFCDFTKYVGSIDSRLFCVLREKEREMRDTD